MYISDKFFSFLLWVFFSVCIAISPLYADALIESTPEQVLVTERQESGSQINLLASTEKIAIKSIEKNTSDSQDTSSIFQGFSDFFSLLYNEVLTDSEILIVSVALLGANLGELSSFLIGYNGKDPKARKFWSRTFGRKALLISWFGLGVVLSLLLSQSYGSISALSISLADSRVRMFFFVTCIHSIISKFLADSPENPKPKLDTQQMRNWIRLEHIELKVREYNESHCSDIEQMWAYTPRLFKELSDLPYSVVNSYWKERGVDLNYHNEKWNLKKCWWCNSYEAHNKYSNERRPITL